MKFRCENCGKRVLKFQSHSSSLLSIYELEAGACIGLDKDNVPTGFFCSTGCSLEYIQDPDGLKIQVAESERR